MKRILFVFLALAAYVVLVGGCGDSGTDEGATCIYSTSSSTCCSKTCYDDGTCSFVCDERG